MGFRQHHPHLIQVKLSTLIETNTSNGEHMRYKEYDEMQLNYYHFFIVITTLKGGEKAKEGQNYKFVPNINGNARN